MVCSVDTQSGGYIVEGDYPVEFFNVEKEGFKNLNEEIRVETIDDEREKEKCWEPMFIDHYMNIPVPKASLTSQPKSSLTPASLLVARTIQEVASGKVLRVLFDSGASHTLIHRSALPPACQPHQMNSVQTKTAAGNFAIDQSVVLKNLYLPEFSKTKKMNSVKAFVFQAPCSYDIILGRDFLSDMGLLIDFVTHTVKWFDKAIPMKPISSLLNRRLMMENSFLNVDQFDPIEEHFEANILDAKYEQATPKEIAEKQQHLKIEERQKLEKILARYSVLFDGGLGKIPNHKVSLELKPGSVPVHSKPYSVPQVHLEVFRKELQHLVEIGVLRSVGKTEWASPTFIIPKKDGRVRWVSDFRTLNKCLKRKVYPLPRIEDIVARRGKYNFFTKLDLSMQYYIFELDEPSQEIATIVTPFGKFAYQRMAMGLCTSPDEAQSMMTHILRDLDVDVYIDDVGIFTDGSYDEHLIVVDKVLDRLQSNGCKMNPLKCDWAVQETDFLGYWLTPNGVKPWKKKVDAILKMKKPETTTQLRSFLGAVTYYRHLWPRRSHILAPLTALSGKPTLQDWNPDCDKAFAEMKALIASDAIMAFPDPNKHFHIFTDASDYQMGAAILQKDDNGKMRPVAYYSKKLSDAQKNYTTTEKEMLAIVYCFREYRSTLLGTRITVYTDHKNLTFHTLSSSRVLRWRLYLEDFSPEFKYHPGVDNTLADCFSRLPYMDKPLEGKSPADVKAAAKGKTVHFDTMELPDKDADEFLHSEHNKPPSEAEIHRTMPCSFKCCRHKTSMLDDAELLEVLFCLPVTDLDTNLCSIVPAPLEVFLSVPDLDLMGNPLKVQNIADHQRRDPKFRNLIRSQPTKYFVKRVRDWHLVHVLTDPTRPDYSRVLLPESMVNHVVTWYHLALGHAGTTRMYETISQTFYFTGLKQRCEAFKCDLCQKQKTSGPGYGLLPPRQASLLPFEEVHIDLVGPWTFTFPTGNKEVTMNALTVIDPVTNLVEIISIESKTAAHVAQKFENVWISRYPKPMRVVFDQGGEFVGAEFQLMLVKHAIKDVPLTSKNPQSNAICERMHRTIGDVLRTTMRVTPPTNNLQCRQLLEDAIATCIYATRVSVSRSLGTSPGNLVFRRDMLFDVPYLADLVTIRDRRQQLVDLNLEKSNKKRRFFEYKVGSQVLIKTFKPNKMEKKAHGPYRVSQVYTNGTLDVERRPGVIERLNIRRLLPYFQPTDINTQQPQPQQQSLVQDVEVAV